MNVNADGIAKPMLIVMETDYARNPGATPVPRSAVRVYLR
jgi:hypothetical protein